jgi:peptidoglycan/xylan/chitin deacetylase (PgdA/CDA1 family)
LGEEVTNHSYNVGELAVSFSFITPQNVSLVNTKRTLKSTALSGLRSTGVFSIAKRSAWRRQKLLILCYHGLSLDDEHEWLPHLFITPERFQQRLSSLRDMNAAVLPLEEALTRLWSDSLPETSVVLTFDDGFFDFLHHGVPLLSAAGFPCTLYLTTHYVKHRYPIANLTLDYVFWKSRKNSVQLPEHGIDTEMPIGSYTERQKAVRHILNRADAQGLSTAGKDELSRSVAERLGVDYQHILDQRLLSILSTEEVAETARKGVDIQLHTHRHRTPPDHDLFVREIRDNRACIHELTGKNPIHFCYPSGNYSREFFPWLAECGVQSATTCERGLATREGDRFLVPRVLDDSMTDLLRFQSVVSGLFT